MAMDSPFIWGAGGARLTPEEIALQRKNAQAMMAQGADFSPIASPWQGAARVVQGLLGGYEGYRADEAAKQNAAESSQLVAALLGGAGGAPTTSSAGPAIAPAAAPSGPTADVIKAGLMQRGLPENVANGFVMNMRDESGLNPAINEAKPIVPGSRGGYGLAQWTGPRRVALEQFAAAAGKPVSDVDTQLDFLVKEIQGPEAKAYSSISATTTPQDAAVAIARDFLRPAPENLERRIAQYTAGTPTSNMPVIAPQANSNMPVVSPQVSSNMPVVGQSARPSVNPAIVQAMTSPYVSDQTRKIGTLLFQNQLAQDKVTTVDLGNKVGIMDARGNIVRSLDKGEPNKGPEFGVIGKDDFGNEKYGWRDPRTQTEKPAAPLQAPTQAQPSTVPPVPAGVDPKVWREGYSKRTTEDSLPASSEAVSGLRKEVQQLPSYKNVAQAAPVYRSMMEAAGRDNRAADVNMIYGMAKIMDPNSVVREGEMTVAQAISTLPQQLRATVESQLTGDGRLSPEVRAQIMQEARGRMLAYQGMFNQDADMYRGIATRGRMNVDDVLPNFGTFDEFKPPTAAKPVVIDGYKIKAR